MGATAAAHSWPLVLATQLLSATTPCAALRTNIRFWNYTNLFINYRFTFKI